MNLLARVSRANHIHNNFYDYSKLPTQFKSSDIVTIICPLHGEFKQRWSNHISKCGCSVCGLKNKKNKLSKGLPHYIRLCNTTHNNKYDYSLLPKGVQYHDSVNIICPTHGIFTQLLGSHIRGSGCRLCSNTTRAYSKTKPIDTYIKMANVIHDGKYDYSLWKEKTKTTSVVGILCKHHGLFYQLLNSHLMGRGCKACKYDKWKNTCIDRYGVDHIKQKNISPQSLKKLNDVDWLLDQHIIQQKSLANIASDLQVSPSAVGNRIHKTNITVKHYFRSAGERNIVSTLQSNFPHITIETNVRNVINAELDIYLPDYNIAIEYNGLYWHSEKHKDVNYHLNKTTMCENAGIRLIHVFQDEWEFHKKKCVDTISHLLGYSPQGTYARNTIIKEIPWKLARDFLNKYHLLDAGQAGNYRIGAFNKSNNLIGVMVFGKQNNEHTNSHIVELRRFVTNKENNPGLGSKLFKFAIDAKQYSKVIAFVDRRWFTGLVKSHIGFNVVGYTKPAVWWTNGNKRFHRRFKTKQQLIMNHEEFSNNMTKAQMLKNLGYYRIYDSGKVKLEWITKNCNQVNNICEL